MKVNPEREKKWWDAKASEEETDFGDSAINRALRWRELDRHLDGVTTILDVGGGTGAFSIPLARRGFRVIHFDHSTEMLKLAREKATGLDNITFVEGNASDLGKFDDHSFDLVLVMDGAISFSGSNADDVIREGCRVTGGVLILTVLSRAALVPAVVGAGLQISKAIVPAVEPMMARGEWHQDDFPENARLAKGVTQDYFGALKAYHPEELRTILVAAGMDVLRLGGMGSLSWLTLADRPELLQTVLADEKLFEQFVVLCERFDREAMPDGPGTRHRCGLIAVAKHKRE